MNLFLYNLIIWLLIPFALLRLLYRSLMQPEYLSSGSEGQETRLMKCPPIVLLSLPISAYLKVEQVGKDREETFAHTNVKWRADEKIFLSE